MATIPQAKPLTGNSPPNDKAREATILFRPLLETYAERYRLTRAIVDQHPRVVALLKDKINSDAAIEMLKRENETLRKRVATLEGRADGPGSIRAV